MHVCRLCSIHSVTDHCAFTGGAFDPWGGPGYDACALLTGPDFENVFYKHNWASNAKLINYYMFYG